LSNSDRARRGAVWQQRRRYCRPPHSSHSSVECGAGLLLFFEPSS
jgi:hypothetical protein